MIRPALLALTVLVSSGCGLLPEDVEPRLTGFATDELRIEWPPDDHPSVYVARWLRDHCYSAAERARRKFRPRLWDASIAVDPPRINLP